MRCPPPAARLLLLPVLVLIAGCVTVDAERDRDEESRKGPASDAETFAVRSVPAGDRAELATGEVVRYAGLRSPRKGEEFFEEARKANERLVFGKGVRIRVVFVEGLRDEDGLRYVHVYAPGSALKLMTWVNTELLEGGWGRLDYRALDPEHERRFEEREAVARTARRGIWKTRG